MPVAQLLGDPGQVEAEREHQRVTLAAATLARGVRLLQYPSGGGRIVGLPVQPGQHVAGGEHVRMILPERRSRRCDRVSEQAAGGCQIAGGA